MAVGLVARLVRWWGMRKDRWRLLFGGGYLVKLGVIRDAVISDSVAWCDSASPGDWRPHLIARDFDTRIWMHGQYLFAHRAQAEHFRIMFSEFKPSQIELVRGSFIQWLYRMPNGPFLKRAVVIAFVAFPLLGLYIIGLAIYGIIAAITKGMTASPRGKAR